MIQDKLNLEYNKTTKERMEEIRQSVKKCKLCGKAWGNSATGFGKTNSPLIFFIGLCPHVNQHRFDDGKGITILKEQFVRHSFNDYYFDNLYKCQPPYKEDKEKSARNCFVFLKKQIDIVKPKNLVLFGHAVSSMLTKEEYHWWNKYESILEIHAWTIPHFSAPLYEGNPLTLEMYYEKFWKMIQEIK